MAGGKTITQRIAFVGGEEMEVQLKRIGNSGAYQFKRIADAAAKADIGGNFAVGMKTLQTGLDGISTAAGKTQRAFSDAGGAIEKFGRNVTIAIAAVGGLAAGFLKLAADAGKSQETLENNARAAGLSVDKYTSLKNAFQIAGIEGGQFDKLMVKMAKSIEEHNKQADAAAKKERDLGKEFIRGKITADEYVERLTDLREEERDRIKDSGDAFDKLGIKISSFGGDTEAALKAISSAVNALPPGFERAALQAELFGARSGTKISAVGTNIAELQAEAKKFAFPEPSIQGAKNLQDYDDALDRIKIALETARRSFFSVFEGTLANLIDGFTKAFVQLAPAIYDVGLAINEFLKPIVSDIIAQLEGRTTAIDRDGFFFKAKKVVLDFYDVLKFLGSAISVVFQGLEALLAPLAAILSKVFGKEITADMLLFGAALLYISGGFKVIFTAISAFQSLLGLVGAFLTPGGLIFLGIIALSTAIVALVAYWPEISKAAGEAFDYVNKKVDEAKDYVRSWIDYIKEGIDNLLVFLHLKDQAQNKADGGGNVGAHAAGGYIVGPGSGTSDSILARLSNGEFVQRTAAVQYYGTSFMSALNNMRIPKSVLNGLAGFAGGGLVRAISDMPRFADGGMVTSGDMVTTAPGGHPLTLVIDGEKFTGMVAEDRTFDKLSKFASRRTTLSGGRKPLWVS